MRYQCALILLFSQVAFANPSTKEIIVCHNSIFQSSLNLRMVEDNGQFKKLILTIREILPDGSTWADVKDLELPLVLKLKTFPADPTKINLPEFLEDRNLVTWTAAYAAKNDPFGLNQGLIEFDIFPPQKGENLFSVRVIDYTGILPIQGNATSGNLTECEIKNEILLEITNSFIDVIKSKVGNLTVLRPLEN